jgi:predicted phosphodiesterase
MTTRIALISDIHANLIALEAVLADVDRVGVDQLIFLGDALTIGPQPKAVVERLKALGCPCIRGNHEDFLLDLPALHNGDHAPWYITIAEWCAAQLEPADFAFLQSFQPTCQIALDAANDLLCCHGSPQSNTDQILPTMSDAALAVMLTGQSARVIACGHTHLPLVRRLAQQTIVNVGSVGAPFMTFPFEGQPRLVPWAEYGLLDWHNGRLQIELRQVPLDLEAIRASALNTDMPGAVEWAATWPNDITH